MKLNPSQVAEIRASTDSITTLAKRFKVSEAAISYHRRGKTKQAAEKKSAPAPITIFGTPSSPIQPTVENGMLVYRIPLTAVTKMTIF